MRLSQFESEQSHYNKYMSHKNKVRLFSKGDYPTQLSKLYYFAYGSNILLKRIVSRVGEVTKIGTFTLPAWKMAFNCGYRDCAFANVRYTGNQQDRVVGVLYELDPNQIYILDHYENAPRNYYKEYFTLESGALAFMYLSTRWFQLSNNGEKEGLPDLPYVNILLDGYIENGFHQQYNSLLQFKIDNYRLKSNRHSFV